MRKQSNDSHSEFQLKCKLLWAGPRPTVMNSINMKNLLTPILFVVSGWLLVERTGGMPGLGIGEESPPLAVSFLAGEQAPTWSSLKGQAVILDFWATWCSPCIKSFPHLNKLVQEFAGQPVKFISLTHESLPVVREFLNDHDLKSLVAVDNDFATFRAFDAWAIPLIVLVTPEGKIAGRIHPNYLSSEIIRQVLDGSSPDVKQVPEGLFDPKGAEEHFRSQMKE